MNILGRSLLQAMWGTKYAYAVLQLKDGDETANELFASMKELKRMGKKPNADHYELKYSAEIVSVPENRMQFLETLYVRFNTNPPFDYQGRSMSVGDVILINDGGIMSFYFVDSIGFKELPCFA